MYSKYYGADFLNTAEYWDDFLSVYKETIVPLPLMANERTLAEVHGMLDCPPGVCGECCRYGHTFVTPEDIKRLDCELDLYPAEGIKSKGGCPFLINNACSVYSKRPEICRTFPIVIVGARALEGKQVEQINIRVKCKAAVEIIRQVIGKALRVNPRFMVLPDLTLIERRF